MRLALIAAAEELASAGVALIQYRNKSGIAREMLDQARELKKRPWISRVKIPMSRKRGETWGTLRLVNSSGSS